MAQYKDENEWYTDYINNYGIDAEGKRNDAIEANQKAYNDGLTAIQRIYDRSAAGYGATAEMLRQNGLNNSGLAAFYQGIAEQNARQERSERYNAYTDRSKEIQKEYEANVKANKQGFALHKQGIQDKTNTYAMEQPYADVEELYAIALGLGADEITARQMAQNAYAYGEGARNRYIEGQYQDAYNNAFAYIDEIAASGGTLNAKAIANLYPNLDAATIQGIVDERIGNYKDTYVNKWATDLANKIVSEGYSTEGKTEAQIAEELGIPAEYVPSVLEGANKMVSEHSNEIATTYAGSFIEDNGLTAADITDDVIKQFADANGISTDAAKNALLSAAQTSDQQYADAKAAIEQYMASGEEIASFQDIVNFGKENGYNISTEEAKRMWNEFAGGNNQENTVKFTGKDGNEYSLSETIIDIYNTAIDNGMTDEEALEYVESNAGKLTEEEKATFDVYRDAVKEETEEFTKTNSEIATNLVNAIISKDKTGIVNLIGEFKTIDNELYQTLSAMNKNGDTSGVVEAVFNWAKVNGNSALVNNVGKEMLNLDYDLVFHDEADGKDVFDLLSAVANGEYGDGSMESTDEQLKYLLNKAGIEITSANVDILDVKNPRDGTETKSGSAKFTIKVQGKNTNVTIPVDVNKTRHFEGGKDGDVASDNGVDLYIKSGNAWYLLKGNTTTTGLSDDEWKVLRGSLAATNIRNVSTLTMKPLGERRRSFSGATINGAPAEHFYDSFISSKEGDNQKKINNIANNAFNLEYKRNLK